VDGGELPYTDGTPGSFAAPTDANGNPLSHVTAQQEADMIKAPIEHDYTSSFTDSDGNTTRYVTTVDMTVGGDKAAGDRMQFQLVSTPWLVTQTNAPGILGDSPGLESGNIAYIDDSAPERTPPHELGHLLGLIHSSQTPDCVPLLPGTNPANNLMSQTGCLTSTAQQQAQIVENIQFNSIVHNPAFFHPPAGPSGP
jgi:hypothetical protein